jgi:integral membrane protein (TIGR01906 family)
VRSGIGERVAGAVTAICAAVCVIAIAILPFLTPAWVSFEQGRTGAARLTGFSDAELGTATNAILHDLVLGPPTFAVEVAGKPVLEERERAHMRDVRGVFAGFYALALVAAVTVVLLIAGARRLGHPERAWRAVRNGMGGLIVGVVIAGIVATFFFDVAFELFHRLFFPGGSYTFDPRTDRLVQLFPFDFWSETTLAVGGLILVLAVVIAFAAGRLARRPVAARPAMAESTAAASQATSSGGAR